MLNPNVAPGERDGSIVNLKCKDAEEFHNQLILGSITGKASQGNTRWLHDWSATVVSDKTKPSRWVSLSLDKDSLVLIKKGQKELHIAIDGRGTTERVDIVQNRTCVGNADWTHGLHFSILTDLKKPFRRVLVKLCGKYLVVQKRTEAMYFDIDNEEVHLVKTKKIFAPHNGS